jgi:hypothetical protein
MQEINIGRRTCRTESTLGLNEIGREYEKTREFVTEGLHISTLRQHLSAEIYN